MAVTNGKAVMTVEAGYEETLTLEESESVREGTAR